MSDKQLKNSRTLDMHVRFCECKTINKADGHEDLALMSTRYNAI